MIRFTQGNLLEAKTEALVNTVNTVGVMGKGIALQLNHFLDTGAVKVNADGTFSVVPEKIRDSVTSLTKQLMEIQGRGDRKAAELLLAKLGVVRPSVAKVLERLKDVPVDIAPRYVTAEELAREPRVDTGVRK